MAEQEDMLHTVEQVVVALELFILVVQQLEVRVQGPLEHHIVEAQEVEVLQLDGNGGAASPYGGKGGNGYSNAGGGAGNPRRHLYFFPEVSGSNGTGGLLVIYSKSIMVRRKRYFYKQWFKCRVFRL